MTKKLWVCVLLAALLAAGAISGFAGPAKKVSIVMGYIPNVQFAPYYIAQRRGYFAEEGLEVSFDYGYATDIMSLVARGEVDFGVSDGDQVIIARDRGLPVKVVYTMYVNYPVGVVSLKSQGIEKIGDLAGKSVGAPVPFGSNYIGLLVLLHSGGLSIDDVRFQSIGYTQIESLLSGKVDAVSVFINNEAVILRNMGYELNVFEARAVTPLVSAAIVIGERTIERKPDVVAGFVRAVSRASRFALEHPERVMEIIRPSIPTISEQNLELNRKVLYASMELWTDRDSEVQGLGYTSPQDWGESVRELRALGLVEGAVDPRECFTNRFLAGEPARRTGSR
ncbi:MAG: ABC transporter substrate-binding protein [Spirochaetota bacterium]